MAISQDFLDYVGELLAPLGTITSRRMFSGAGVYLDGMIIALILRDTFYFKVDDQTRPSFMEAGSNGPFVYDTQDGPRTMNGYWTAPERLFDEPEEFQAFARAALGVSLRSAKSKPAKRSARRKGAA
jgi:DNA transformation protein and related proteins